MRLRLLPSKRPPGLIENDDMEVGGIYKLVQFNGDEGLHPMRIGALYIVTDERGAVALEDGWTMTRGEVALARWGVVEQPVLHYQE
jgi:hypothetical protein